MVCRFAYDENLPLFSIYGMSQAYPPLEWHFALWVWASSDDQGRLQRFLSDKLEALGRSLSSEAASPLFEVRPLSLIDQTPWVGTGVVVRPREDMLDYEKHQFGACEFRRICRLAEKTEKLPVGFVGLFAAWVGSSETSNASVNGQITFEPVLKLVLEEKGFLGGYSFDDAFGEVLDKVIPARQGCRSAGEAVVPLADEICSIAEQIARRRFEQIPPLAALVRQAALDVALPKPSKMGGFKGRF